MKKIQSDSGPERCRLQVSNGLHYQPCMLATQMNDKVHNGELCKYTVIELRDTLSTPFIRKSEEKLRMCVCVCVCACVRVCVCVFVHVYVHSACALQVDYDRGGEIYIVNTIYQK